MSLTLSAAAVTISGVVSPFLKKNCPFVSNGLAAFSQSGIKALT